jgi:GT2 family glycosyltransferase
LSVVVPSHNGGSLLVRSLEAVGAGRPGFDLIIVDNASSDGSVEKALERFPQARVITNDSNQGFAHPCNQGAAISRADFVLFLNNDAFIDPADLDRLISAAKDDASGAAWQPVNVRTDGTVDFSGDYFTWWGFFLHLQDFPPKPELRTVFATRAACLLVRRDVFNALGGFNADYFAYFEETDFCWRARLAGWEVRVVPDAHVEHIGGVTTSRLLSPHQVRYLAFRNRFRTILANASGRTLARIVPLHLIACLAFGLLFLVTGRVRSMLAILSAIVWPLAHADELRQQRKHVKTIRRLADSAVLRKDLTAPVAPSKVWRHLAQQIYRWERQSSAHGPDSPDCGADANSNPKPL